MIQGDEDAGGPTDTKGAGDGCACVHRSARLCAQIRYYSDDTDETGDDACQCLCHEWDDEDDYE